MKATKSVILVTVIETPEESRASERERFRYHTEQDRNHSQELSRDGFGNEEPSYRECDGVVVYCKDTGSRCSFRRKNM